MKKKLTFILSALCLSTCMYAQGETAAFAQTLTTPQVTVGSGRSIEIKSKSYNYEFSIGPRVGVGAAMMSNGDNMKFADGTGFGFDAGLGLNVRFGGKDSKGRALNGQGLCGIALELNYAYGTHPTVTDESLKLGYFEVPVLFQIYPGFKTKQLKNLYIELGPTFAALVNKSPEGMAIDGSTTLMTGGLKGGDIKGTVGLGYRFNRGSANDGFYVNFRYNIGFSDLAGNLPCKTSSAELTFGYLFKCVGGKKK